MWRWYNTGKREEMKKIIVIFICGFVLLGMSRPVMAAGVLKRLKVISDNMALQEKALDKEAKNYKKAEEFIDSQDVKKGLAPDFIVNRCGEPAARADHGRRWVYKPPGSTYFKGEKIYLIFDESDRLSSWKKLRQ